jgi:hypothetical protein
MSSLVGGWVREKIESGNFGGFSFSLLTRSLFDAVNARHHKPVFVNCDKYPAALQDRKPLREVEQWDCVGIWVEHAKKLSSQESQPGG